MRQRPLGGAGGAAGRAPAPRRHQRRSARGGKGQPCRCCQRDVSPGGGRGHSAAGRLARFCLFARGAPSRAGHRPRHPRHRPQAQARRAVSRLSLLRLRQPSALVPPDLARQHRRARGGEPAALLAALCRQPADRGPGLLAARAARPSARCGRHAAGIVATLLLPRQVVLRDAHRCLRSLLHPAGAALHTRADRDDARGGGIRGHPVLADHAVLVRGRNQESVISSRNQTALFDY